MRGGRQTILVLSPTEGRTGIVLPVAMSAKDMDTAAKESAAVWRCIDEMAVQDGRYPLIIPEDRWRSSPETIRPRLLAHLEIFTSLYARNCEIRRIDKNTAKEFLERYHSYGYASCRYHYGIYVKRHTGHLKASSGNMEPGTLAAVATFSNARKWIKGDKTIRSYEWTRYASLPDVRISGAMGRVLSRFIEDAAPDDIMSYADLEWSEGMVYEALGFTAEGMKSPVSFRISPHSWKREAIRKAPDGNDEIIKEDDICYCNLGSCKYRLKLTDY